MKIKVEAVKAEQLKPGDLFTRAPQIYWDYIDENESVGEKVYVRTNTECPPDQIGVDIYRVTIIKP